MKRTDKDIKTLRLRIKDKHATMLLEMASAVNFVFNYCNELSMKVWERERRFIGTAEIQSYLNGASKEGLMVGSAVFQQVADEYVTRRGQHKKIRLKWRKSLGKRRSLGWIPFKARSLAYRSGQIQFQGKMLSLWDSYGLKDYELGAGSLSEDSRGRWYINICATTRQKAQHQLSLFNDAVGIDLGLKDFAATSDGAVIEARQFYRNMEEKLGIAQRANKKNRVKAVHTRIANQRKDFQHKLSAALSKSYGAIFVGNVNASALAKTNQAKSVLDASWSQFRTMTQYKCKHAGTWFDEVSEAYSTQTCSRCESRSGPKGQKGLRIREWKCEHCGAVHHRDINGAIKILAAGRRRLAVGIPALPAQAAARKG
jgi:IS605 OrfB family transposase